MGPPTRADLKTSHYKIRLRRRDRCTTETRKHVALLAAPACTATMTHKPGAGKSACATKNAQADAIDAQPKPENTWRSLAHLHARSRCLINRAQARVPALQNPTSRVVFGKAW